MSKQRKDKQSDYYIKKNPYQCIEWNKYLYHNLTELPIKSKRGKKSHITYNNIIVMLDTETSKSKANDYDDKGKAIPVYNYIVGWTLSIRCYQHNIVTLYGHNPQEIVDCVDKLKQALRGHELYIYIHNISYDITFLQKFFYAAWGYPEHQLNTKSHYPINVTFANGVIFKDSLILAQRSIEKWADDLNVEHKKAVGKWDYDKIRNQSDAFTPDEVEYMEHDTLAGVECIDATMQALHKSIASLYATATGIPRDGVFKAGGSRAKEIFNKIVPTFEQQNKLQNVYHGGYTHGNRHFIDTKIDDRSIKELFPELEGQSVKAADFSSSYPFTILSEKFPMTKFVKMKDCCIKDILESCIDYAYIFKLILIHPRLKDDNVAMPALQFSKCEKSINAICDNGRILCADYVEIYLCDPDLEVIAEQYIFDKHICVDVEFAHKGYLPRYLTDYVYQCYVDKCMLKNGDPVMYAIAKAKVNSIYGMMVQQPVKLPILQDYVTNEYYLDESVSMVELYDKYKSNRKKILCYQWGVYVTAYAYRNLFQLGKCFDVWLYSDTDSCYGIGLHQDLMDAYNEKCKEKLRANGYGAVLYNNREYWLGIAEHDPVDDVFSEFKYMGAKRYCYRYANESKKHGKDLKITVAGVPKKKGVKCLDDSIDNFSNGFLFAGGDTGKLTHYYLNEQDICKDSNGNLYADSIDLVKCDYLLSKVRYITWDDLMTHYIQIQTYEEE